MTQADFKAFYTNLTESFEGYIQLSDSKDFIILNNEPLPQWEALHNGRNFIHQMCLYSPTTQRSINATQINNGFNVLDKNLADFENSAKNEIEFLANTQAHKHNISQIKITQIWQEVADELCCDFDVLMPTFTLFSGFTKGENND